MRERGAMLRCVAAAALRLRLCEGSSCSTEAAAARPNHRSASSAQSVFFISPPALLHCSAGSWSNWVREMDFSRFAQKVKPFSSAFQSCTTHLPLPSPQFPPFAARPCFRHGVLCHIGRSVRWLCRRRQGAAPSPRNICNSVLVIVSPAPCLCS